MKTELESKLVRIISKEPNDMVSIEALIRVLAASIIYSKQDNKVIVEIVKEYLDNAIEQLESERG